MEREMRDVEGWWMKDQMEMVKVGREKEELEANVGSLKDQVYIFTRKLFRIEGMWRGVCWMCAGAKEQPELLI